MTGIGTGAFFDDDAAAAAVVSAFALALAADMRRWK